MTAVKEIEPVKRIYIPGIWSEATGGIAMRYFVRAVDFDATAAERDTLRAQNERLVKALELARPFVVRHTRAMPVDVSEELRAIDAALTSSGLSPCANS